MEFHYLFLLVGTDPAKLEARAQALQRSFPNCSLQSAENPQDAVDFCRANVYDLVISDCDFPNMKTGDMITEIRDLNNDNLSTGFLLVGEPAEPLEDLGHVMFSKGEFEPSSFLQQAKILISLKQA